MANCQDTSLLMSLSLDGQLSADKAARLREHVNRCSACQTEWVAMQHISHLLSRAPMVAPPADFVVKVCQRLAGGQERQGNSLFGGMVLVMGSLSLGALALPAVAVGLLLVWQVVEHPFLLNYGLHLLFRLVDVVAPVVRAACLTAGGLLSTPVYTVLIAYSLSVFALTVVWIRLVVGRQSGYRPMTVRAGGQGIHPNLTL